MIRKREIWCREFLPYSEMMMIARRRTMRPEITKTTPRRHRFRFSFFPSRFLHHILLHCIDYALLRWPVLLSLDTRTLSSSCAADEWQTARGSLVSSPSSNEEAEVLLPRLSLRWQIWVADDYVMLVFLGTLFLFSFFSFRCLKDIIARWITMNWISIERFEEVYTFLEIGLEKKKRKKNVSINSN